MREKSVIEMLSHLKIRKVTVFCVCVYARISRGCVRGEGKALFERYRDATVYSGICHGTVWIVHDLWPLKQLDQDFEIASYNLLDNTGFLYSSLFIV